MRIPLALLLLAPTLAQAEGHGITVKNSQGETIRGIHIAPAGSGSAGENRLRSQLPAGAEARISYNTGCRADIRLNFDNGRTEDHKDVDVCTDPRIIAGQEGVAGPAMTPTARGAAGPAARTPAPTATQVAKGPVVPPWTGHSITKRFGGLD